MRTPVGIAPVVNLDVQVGWALGVDQVSQEPTWRRYAGKTVGLPYRAMAGPVLAF